MIKLFCIIGAILNMLAATCVKKWSISNQIIYVIAACVLYAIDTTFWILMFKFGAKLSVSGVLWAAISLGLSSIIGILFFQEKLSIREIVGCVLMFIGILICNSK